ncbi:MAG TPA: DUF2470 domain-containing protein [Phycisphaerales bacterium]|nr:DUF2470 domain-containing protein [Phycisphaerales bacterium]
MPDLFDDPSAEKLALSHALDLFDSCREGVLIARIADTDTAWPIKFVTCPESGRLITCLAEEALRATEYVLHVPEEKADSLQFLISLEKCGESSATDHYLGYHGKPEGVHAPTWVECWIDAARRADWVFDGEAFMTPNPLASAECPICKRLNADPAKLSQLCKAVERLDIPSPVCVGVVPSGLHVRARFGVVRIPFGQRLESPAEAEKRVEEMLLKT